MTAWWALCRREWLEHRGALAWTPLAAAALLIALTLLVALSNPERMISSTESSALPDGQNFPSLITSQITGIIQGFVRPFIWLYFSVTAFLLLGTLFDERKDRTILFWKSMPTSNTQAVLSKLFVLVGVGALISLTLILVTQLYLVLLTMANASTRWGISGEELWSYAALGKSTVDWVAGYFTQLFWSLPLWGWLLLVSSTAPRLPILWATIVPIVPMIIEWAAFDSGYLMKSVVSHLSLLALPHTNPQLSALWTSSGMWLGVATGVLFIALAIVFRRRNNEL